MKRFNLFFADPRNLTKISKLFVNTGVGCTLFRLPFEDKWSVNAQEHFVNLKTKLYNSNEKYFIVKKDCVYKFSDVIYYDRGKFVVFVLPDNPEGWTHFRVHVTRVWFEGY